MAAPILHVGASVLCSHAGQAVPSSPNPRVLVGGQPAVTVSTPYLVAGCGLTGTPRPPCATGQWLAGATRVLAGGEPLAVRSAPSVCTPSGAPMTVVAVQQRVVAT